MDPGVVPVGFEAADVPDGAGRPFALLTGSRLKPLQMGAPRGKEAVYQISSDQRGSG